MIYVRDLKLHDKEKSIREVIDESKIRSFFLFLIDLIDNDLSM